MSLSSNKPTRAGFTCLGDRCTLQSECDGKDEEALDHGAKLSNVEIVVFFVLFSLLFFDGG